MAKTRRCTLHKSMSAALFIKKMVFKRKVNKNYAKKIFAYKKYSYLCTR